MESVGRVHPSRSSLLIFQGGEVSDDISMVSVGTRKNTTLPMKILMIERAFGSPLVIIK